MRCEENDCRSGDGQVTRSAGKLKKHVLQSLVVIAAATAVLGFAFGGMGVAVAAMLSLLWLAWRFDNQTGSCLMLTILLLIVIAVPAMLLVLMAVTH